MSTSMQARKSVVTPVIPPQLREADVVLSRGIGTLSDIIVGLDGGTYSHAAFYDGEMFIQAMKKGVSRTEPVGIPGEQEFLDDFRFHTLDGRILGHGANEVTPQPVTDEATRMIGLEFDYGALVQALRMLHVRRNAPAAWDDRWAAVLRNEMAAYRRDKHDPNETKLTCTELVTRAFWNATQSGTNRDYAIWVQYQRPKPADFRSDEYDRVLDESARFLADEDPQFSVDAAAMSHDFPDTLKPGDVIAGSPRLQAQFVTPYDLEHSSSMTGLGRIWPTT
ncbi:MAG TPA: hypothetical protein VFO82_03865 [Steroidobacteraceae bacterium]|nr:hypothetical protein [Steroidobacteraceae bacterium]